METFSSLVALLAERAQIKPDDRAYVFLSDRGAEEAALTFRQLHDAARALAARLTAIAQPGDRAILVFPPGLEFIVAFFGCLIARVIAVPMMMPRRQSARDSSAAIMANCEPAVALTTSAFAIRWICRHGLRAKGFCGCRRYRRGIARDRRNRSAAPCGRTTSPSCNTRRARRPNPRASWSATPICSPISR